ncbi:GNAT family N-acetyltransferase [Babesia caballi]|uniref:GNAT family N-acetyltransferase n=1 Tax=Babesia caballi TaxID=5871 RepID=A0AAV4LWV0_BABCB|nr:GNAT family N-acetyltransferase [Babesia caballi]
MESRPSSSCRPRTLGNTRRGRGIAFTAGCSQPIESPSSSPTASAGERTQSPHGDVNDGGDPLLCYDKPSWDIKRETHTIADFEREQRPSRSSMTQTESPAAGIVVSRSCNAPVRLRRAVNSSLLHRAVLQAESHNKALEKAEMWKRYSRSLQTLAPKKRSREEGDRK